MSLNLNVCHFAGNVTRDPEVKFLSGERAVANFGLAINRKWKSDDGQPKEEVVFLDLVAYGRTAEIAGQYLAKGRACMVEARAKLEQWEDKKDGSKRSKIVFIIDRLHLMGDGKPERQEGDAAQAEANEKRHEVIGRDGLRRNPRPASGDDEPPL